MTRAVHIDAKACTVTEVVVTGLPDLQRLVGGYIEVARSGNPKVTLYVDEEGMIKSLPRGFLYNNCGPYYGNGVVIGGPDREGDDTDLAASLEEVTALVQFGRFADVEA